MQERLVLPVQPCRSSKCGKKFDTTLYYAEMDEICTVTVSKRKYGLCDPYLQNSTHLCLICLASLPVYAIFADLCLLVGCRWRERCRCCRVSCSWRAPRRLSSLACRHQKCSGRRVNPWPKSRGCRWNNHLLCLHKRRSICSFSTYCRRGHNNPLTYVVHGKSSCPRLVSGKRGEAVLVAVKC